MSSSTASSATPEPSYSVPSTSIAITIFCTLIPTVVQKSAGTFGTAKRFDSLMIGYSGRVDRSIERPVDR